MNIVPMILAAGKGTRMKSSLPKVLHKAAGLPMLSHVLNACEGLTANSRPVVVVGHGASLVQETYGDGLIYALQQQQLGTGHAVMTGFAQIPQDADGVLVACGDTPLLRPDTLQQMAALFQQTKAACVLLTAYAKQPQGYGRIIRNSKGQIQGIVEEKDATPEQRAITEINTGTYLFARPALEEALSHLSCDNAQKEYYLTDAIAYLAGQGAVIQPLVGEFLETLGVNDQKNLAFAARMLYQRQAEALMAEGVCFLDPAATYVDVTVQVGRGTVIEPQCYLRGNTVIGEDCLIGMGSDITDSIIGDRVAIKHSVIWEASIAPECTIGPFAYLRPGSVLEEQVKVGDFSEIKKSHIGKGSKVPHLSYIGDATIGERVNIGCGTITCNYDGYNKYQTTIGDHVFIGSNTNLVAPVTIGDGALVAAGSTIVKDVPAQALGVARGKQEVREQWAQKRRQQKEAQKTQEIAKE